MPKPPPPTNPVDVAASERGLKLMLVDPRPSLRCLALDVLRAHIELDDVSEFSGGEQACGKYLRVQPDVVVCSLELPGISGAETIDRLIRRHPRAAVVAMGRDGDGIRRDRALKAGARGYLRESRLRHELPAAVAAVTTDHHYLDRETANEIALGGPHPATPALDALSVREFEVFCLIVAGQPLDAIAQRLSLGYKTVAGYGTRIRSKLGVKKGAALEALAADWGLRDR